MGLTVRQAATRIFSNAPVPILLTSILAAENSSWEDEKELQNM
jgi:magnesium chelatase subunit H